MGRGGAGNKGKGKKSKIIPIAHWLSHQRLWMMGYNYDCVLEELYDANYNNSDSDGNDNITNKDFSDYKSVNNSNESDYGDEECADALNTM